MASASNGAWVLSLAVYFKCPWVLTMAVYFQGASGRPPPWLFSWKVFGSFLLFSFSHVLLLSTLHHNCPSLSMSSFPPRGKRAVMSPAADWILTPHKIHSRIHCRRFKANHLPPSPCPNLLPTFLSLFLLLPNAPERLALADVANRILC